VAIAGETLGAEEFQSFWSGELYIDEGKAGVFKVLDAGKQGLLSGAFSYYTGGDVRKNADRCSAKGVEGNMEGEGLMLGGVWAFSPTELVYEHKEGTWGDTIAEPGRLDELRAAIDGFSPLPSSSP